jgi:hypothetical protein
MTIFDSSTLVEQSCGDCIIRIGTWFPWKGDPGTVNVEVISNRGYGALKQRIKNAWKTLRGRYDWTGFEVYTVEELDGIIAGLQAAKGVAFPEVTNL